MNQQLHPTNQPTAARCDPHAPHLAGAAPRPRPLGALLSLGRSWDLINSRPLFKRLALCMVILGVVGGGVQEMLVGLLFDLFFISTRLRLVSVWCFGCFGCSSGSSTTHTPSTHSRHTPRLQHTPPQVQYLQLTLNFTVQDQGTLFMVLGACNLVMQVAVLPLLVPLLGEARLLLLGLAVSCVEQMLLAVAAAKWQVGLGSPESSSAYRWVSACLGVCMPV
jgi:hypothetical protein